MFINHRELGQQGIFVRPIETLKTRSKRRPGTPAWFKVGNEIDFYDRNGDKKYGIIRKITSTHVTIQDVNTKQNHKMELRDNEAS